MNTIWVTKARDFNNFQNNKKINVCGIYASHYITVKALGLYSGLIVMLAALLLLTPIGLYPLHHVPLLGAI